MAIQITDAVSLQALAKSDPFGSASMFKDPSAVAATQVTAMSSKLSGISTFPGLDSSLQGQFASLSSSMGAYTSGISESFASRMGSFTDDMGKIGDHIDLFDMDQPCDMIHSVMGSFSKIGDIMSSAMSGLKKLMAPVISVMGDIFDAAHTLTTEALSAIHSAMGAISSAISSAMSYMATKLTEFKNMVASEISALGNPSPKSGNLKIFMRTPPLLAQL